ncbi:hypothetical protein PYCCODRAFT_1471769, partial [Trametes coccinea BRFM310]
DDAGRVRRYIHAIARWDDPKLQQKSERGFNHTITGRLLCPVTLLGKFDEDPPTFCRGLRDLTADREWVTGDDWPSFLYDMQEHEPGQVKTGLLKSKLLLDCYKLIFTGPASALPELAPGGHNKAKGKPPVINKFETPSESITIYAIIYIACLTRHALNTHSDWADDDGDFKGIIFVRTLLTTAIRDPEWRREICAWYKRRVLDQPDGREPPPNRQTAYSMMMREAIHEPQSQYDQEEPEQPEEQEADSSPAEGDDRDDSEVQQHRDPDDDGEDSVENPEERETAES